MIDIKSIYNLCYFTKNLLKCFEENAKNININILTQKFSNTIILHPFNCNPFNLIFKSLFFHFFDIYLIPNTETCL